MPRARWKRMVWSKHCNTSRICDCSSSNAGSTKDSKFMVWARRLIWSSNERLVVFVVDSFLMQKQLLFVCVIHCCSPVFCMAIYIVSTNAPSLKIIEWRVCCSHKLGLLLWLHTTSLLVAWELFLGWALRDVVLVRIACWFVEWSSERNNSLFWFFAERQQTNQHEKALHHGSFS